MKPAITLINTEKVNNVIFFNPKSLKESDFIRKKYDILQLEEDFVIHPTDHDTEKQKISSFKKFRENLYKDIRNSDKFCDGLKALFVKDSLKDCDFILRIESSQTRSKKINGFATLKILKYNKSLYIDVICTNTDIKGTGTHMVNLLSNLCKSIGLESIKLSATESAVPFYLKNEFECNPLCKMIKHIGGSKTKKNRNSIYSKTIRRH
jgi:hypothetical protein